MKTTNATDKEIWYCIYDGLKKEVITEIQIEKGCTVIDNSDDLGKTSFKVDTKIELENKKLVLQITKKA